jgi:xanthine dehydrogenase accessory factor
MSSFFDTVVQATKNNQKFALGIITGVKGSSPQKIGAKALFFEDGAIHGTLGGGCLEAEVQDRARRTIVTKKPETFELILDHDFGWDDGLICGGKVQGVIIPEASKAIQIWEKLAGRECEMKWGITKDFQIEWLLQEENEWIYEETVSPPCELWIAGAGHIAQAIAPLALDLDFSVTVMDDRPALANHQFFPKEANLVGDSWEKIFKKITPPEAPTFGLILTRGHRHDALVLENWIHRPFAYLGMIGSRRKARIILDHFKKEKIADDKKLQQLHCPVGVDIQAQSVKEIAVSICAQLIEKRREFLDGLSGKHYSDASERRPYQQIEGRDVSPKRPLKLSI